MGSKCIWGKSVFDTHVGIVREEFDNTLHLLEKNYTTIYMNSNKIAEHKQKSINK